MDRDKRWDRNKLACGTPLCSGAASNPACPPRRRSSRSAYTHEPRGDEFLQPIIFSHGNEQRVRDGDVVLWFNFRADRARQLSVAFLQKGFKGFDREVTPGVFITSRSPSTTARTAVPWRSSRSRSRISLAKSSAQRVCISSASPRPRNNTRHVTYFFNGGVERQFPGEDRIIVPSPKDVPTYDFKPQMSAPQVTEKVVAALPDYDLVILNFANPDMVGHTGVVEAGVKAVETIDACVKAVVEKTLTSLGGKLLLTADHGNCELMRNPDGSPNTGAHDEPRAVHLRGSGRKKLPRGGRHPRRCVADAAFPAGPPTSRPK